MFGGLFSICPEAPLSPSGGGGGRPQAGTPASAATRKGRELPLRSLSHRFGGVGLPTDVRNTLAKVVAIFRRDHKKEPRENMFMICVPIKGGGEKDEGRGVGVQGKKA